MRWRTGTLLWETPAAPGGTEAPPVPGPGESGVPPVEPAAVPSTPDSDGRGPPETIPYGRFKEVNDQLAELRDFRPLAEAGFTADDLSSLASFGLAYDSDPVGTWAKMADSIDLPQEVKDAITEHVSAGSAQPGEGSDPQPQPGDRQEPSPEVKYLMEREQARVQAEEQAAGDEVLDSIIAKWGEADTKDRLEVPDMTKLTYIQAVLGAGGYNSLDQVAEMARQSYMAERERTLQSAITTPGSSPLTVPGSGGTVPSSEPRRFGDLREASRQAAADIEAGRLPGPRP